ncbi:hypothetical protein Pgy4_25153, partial [Pseudomonas savastanoi pv. glycinea str. race 4]
EVSGQPMSSRVSPDSDSLFVSGRQPGWRRFSTMWIVNLPPRSPL